MKFWVIYKSETEFDCIGYEDRAQAEKLIDKLDQAIQAIVIYGDKCELIRKKTEIVDPNTCGVRLVSVGENKIMQIKVTRECLNIGLREAKDLVEGCPRTLKVGNFSYNALEKLAHDWNTAGGKASLCRGTCETCHDRFACQTQ